MIFLSLARKRFPLGTAMFYAKEVTSHRLILVLAGALATAAIAFAAALAHPAAQDRPALFAALLGTYLLGLGLGRLALNRGG